MLSDWLACLSGSLIGARDLSSRRDEAPHDRRDCGDNGRSLVPNKPCILMRCFDWSVSKVTFFHEVLLASFCT